MVKLKKGSKAKLQRSGFESGCNGAKQRANF